MKKRYLIALFSLSILMALPGFSSPLYLTKHAKNTLLNNELEGKVLDQNAVPVIGALIRIKGSDTVVMTDENGQFALSLPEGKSTISVEILGYKTKEVQITDFKSKLEIVLEEDLLLLDELVVTGYSTESRRNITSSIATVDPAEISTLPKADVAEMLQGRAAGVQVMSDNTPGGGNAIRIRGFSTINNNEPLVIIDGVPVANGLNTLNPNDIKSMQVLKDAASASIYGSRAANGVVLITTKTGGKDEKPTIELNSYAGVQQAFNLPRMLDAQEYGDMLWQASKNDGKVPSHDIYGDDPNTSVVPAYLNDAQTIPSGNTDWVQEIFRPAAIQSHNLTLTKGGDRSSQVFSLGYFNQDGVIKETGFNRFTGRFNSFYKVADFLTIGENLNASYSERVSVGTNRSLGSIVYNAYQYPSIIPVYDNNGEFAGNPINDLQNPLGQLTRSKDNSTKEVKLFGNIYGDISIGDFTFHSSAGLDYLNSNSRSFSPVFNEILTLNLINSLSTNNASNYQMTFTNTLNYKNNIGDHNFDVIIGQEAVKYFYEGFSASRQSFMYETDNFWFLNYGTENQLNSGSANGRALNSYFGKLNYNLGEKYLLTATLRQDGTSRLVGENKWGTFPAFSLGWRLDEEEFFNKNSAVSSVLLRGGWGRTGNQQVPSYSTIRSYTSYNTNSNYGIDGSQNTVQTGLVESRVANPNLKWETTTQTSLGADLGFLDDALQVSAEYYFKNTKDILVYASLPLTYGGSNDGVWVNDGKMRNQGFESNISYNGQARDLSYGVNLNFTSFKNELTELNNATYLGIPSSSLHSINFGQEVSRSAVGQPIGSFFGYVADGIFQTAAEIDAYGAQPNAQPGDLKFKDLNNDGVVDGDDRTYIGSPIPDFMLGFTLDLNYKGFDVNAFFSGSFGSELYNLTKYKTYFFNQAAYNKSSAVLDAWTPQNTDTDIPRLSLDDANNNIRPSSYYVEDGSYVKLGNLQLGYTFGPKLQNARIFVQGTNLFYITKYSGLTPEVGLQSYSSSNRNLDIGIDRGLYPPARTFAVGLNIKY
ncbi:SusC/RagA family TonB-linked outer membrane protein [Jiulongibacter sp. NS-SX5]|uniref:SusC/RagA family TonB-linked outer membrane protein n=1 Tax=Jiulongibacter sp. NS-SX5 TaxID=3463854 RepID=UPI004058E800